MSETVSITLFGSTWELKANALEPGQFLHRFFFVQRYETYWQAAFACGNLRVYGRGETLEEAAADLEGELMPLRAIMSGTVWFS